MAIWIVGLNHTTAPVALRERLYFGPSSLGGALSALRALSGIDEAVLLSTCNRTEALCIGDSPTPVIDYLAGQAQCDAEALRPHVYLYQGREAIAHLFRVACGLDSLVVGETQILKQVRDALDAALAHGSAGRLLHSVMQQAIATGKRARTDTAISYGAFSIGHVAVALVRSLFPDLQESPVLILGAGKMSELTAKHLAANGVSAIFVANRTHAHAEALAQRLGGKAISYEALAEALIEVDILISSTSAPHTILHAPDIARVMARRQQRPLCLIDIAVPRDIDPAVGDLPHVHLYNVDDLRGAAEENQERRQAEIPKVEAIIHRDVERCCARLAGMDVAGTIHALRATFEQMRRAELERVMPALAGLTPEQQAAVEAMTSALVNKLLHTPTVRLKAMLAADPDCRPQALLGELFALETEDEVADE